MMNSRSNKNRKLNFGLTRKVIELQAQGYHFDYLPLCNRQLLCIQNNQTVSLDAVDIYLVDQGYDQLSRSFKYIHTIETSNGESGMMIEEGIMTNRGISA